MADFRAIGAVCDTVVSLLQDNFDNRDFGGNDLTFQVFQAKDFARPMAAGVSLFLYRVYPNGTSRRPPGRLGPDGRRDRPQLPVDLHFLLTAWAAAPSLQQSIVGWMMRVMEDISILPASLLNAAALDSFHPDEGVEVMPAELPNEELLRLWADLVQNVYQLSVPYVARNVYIESRRTLVEGAPIQQRSFDFREVAV